MVLDQIRHLESRRRNIVHRIELLRAGKWWHIGTREEAEARMLAELDEVDDDLLCIQTGAIPKQEWR